MEMDTVFILMMMVLAEPSVISGDASPSSPACRAEYSVRYATIQTAKCSGADVTDAIKPEVHTIEMFTASGRYLASLNMNTRQKAEGRSDQIKNLAVRTWFPGNDASGTISIAVPETPGFDLDNEEVVCRYHLDSIEEPEKKNAIVRNYPAQEHTWKMHAVSRSEPGWGQIEVETNAQTVFSFRSSVQTNNTLEFVDRSDVNKFSIRTWKRYHRDNSLRLIVVTPDGSELATAASTGFKGQLKFDKLKRCRYTPPSSSSSSAEPCLSLVFQIAFGVASFLILIAVGVAVYFYRKRAKKVEDELPETVVLNE